LGQIVGGPNLALLPNQSFTISGIATSRPIDVTSRAIGGAVRKWRKRRRSRIKPRSGPTMTTARMNAGRIGHSWVARVS
jgi:hypothetical protein